MDKQKSIVEMLKAELDASDEFSKENFGLKYGDGFRELAMELMLDDKILMHAVAKAVITVMSFDRFTEFIRKHGDDPEPPTALLYQAVRKNPNLIDDQLAMLFFGIQIGRKLAAQEAVALQTMETKEQP